MLMGWPTASAPARAMSGARKISVSGGGGADVCAKSASATTNTYRMGRIIWRDGERRDRKDHRHIAIASTHACTQSPQRTQSAGPCSRAATGSPYEYHRDHQVTE